MEPLNNEVLGITNDILSPNQYLNIWKLRTLVSKEVATCASCVYLSKINQNKRGAQKKSRKVEKKRKGERKKKQEINNQSLIRNKRPWISALTAVTVFFHLFGTYEGRDCCHQLQNTVVDITKPLVVIASIFCRSPDPWKVSHQSHRKMLWKAVDYWLDHRLITKLTGCVCYQILISICLVMIWCMSFQFVFNKLKNNTYTQIYFADRRAQTFNRRLIFHFRFWITNRRTFFCLKVVSCTSI